MAEQFVIADGIRDLLQPFLGEIGAYAVAWVLIAFILLNILMATGGLLSFFMRKIMARIQTRYGPNRVGPFGLLQFLADGIKLVSKEDLTPARADPAGFKMAPFFVAVPVIAAFAPIPFSDTIILADVRLGLLLVLAVTAVAPIGEMVAGWASNNKYSMMGAIRAAAMDVSYEIPLMLAALSVVMLASSLGGNGLNFNDIVRAQNAGVWFILLQPIGAFIFFAAALAKAGIIPTDLAEAESELVAGFFTEYSGMRWGVFFIGVFLNIVLISTLTVLLFFGGWSMPFITGTFTGSLAFVDTILGLVFFTGKVAFFILFVIITWFTLPRFRPDQFLTFGWKVMFPLAIVNLVVTLLEIQFLVPVLAGGA